MIFGSLLILLALVALYRIWIITRYVLLQVRAERAAERGRCLRRTVCRFPCFLGRADVVVLDVCVGGGRAAMRRAWQEMVKAIVYGLILIAGLIGLNLYLPNLVQFIDESYVPANAGFWVVFEPVLHCCGPETSNCGSVPPCDSVVVSLLLSGLQYFNIAAGVLLGFEVCSPPHWSSAAAGPLRLLAWWRRGEGGQRRRLGFSRAAATGRAPLGTAAQFVVFVVTIHLLRTEQYKGGYNDDSPDADGPYATEVPMEQMGSAQPPPVLYPPPPSFDSKV